MITEYDAIPPVSQEARPLYGHYVSVVDHCRNKQTFQAGNIGPSTFQEMIADCAVFTEQIY